MAKKQKSLHHNVINRQNFYLWMFISQEGLWDDAKEFLAENMGMPIPLEQAEYGRMSFKPVDWAHLK